MTDKEYRRVVQHYGVDIWDDTQHDGGDNNINESEKYVVDIYGEYYVLLHKIMYKTVSRQHDIYVRP